MKKLFSLFVALVATITLWAGNTITYTATEKLSETYSEWYSGLRPNAFNVSITSHTFADGTGTITFDGEVTSIGYKAFCYCSGLTSVTIPNSVTSIGEKAFDSCSNLTSITIPNSVTSIGDNAFNSCSGLTSITIGNSVTSIGYGAFENCSGLTSVIWNAVNYASPSYSSDAPFYRNCSQITNFTFGEEVESIPAYLCYGMNSLTSITIPNSVTSIGEGAFLSCSGLTSVTIGNSVTSIGYHAFYECSGLTSIVVESGNTNYDSRDNCNAIIETSTNTLISGCQNTIIPNSVSSIGGSAFAYCSGLTSVTIGNSVTSIGSQAFRYCSGLTSVTIPNSVTSIGYGAFYGCSGLTSITIPNSVTNIGGSAFSGCSGLTSVIWNAVNYASPSSSSDAPFYNIRSQITSFTFGEEVESIPAYLCYGMNSLTSITIPNSVTSIGVAAFYECSGLTSITIPNSVTSIGDYAFFLCSGLPVENNLRYADKYLVEAVDEDLSTYSIKEGTKWIGSSAFWDCTGLTSITIPNSVTSIGDGAFHNCSGLTSITIPNSVTSIGDGVFENCSGLTSITIPNSVTSIGEGAFLSCSGLTSVTIGNSVTSIGESAFSDCTNLDDIYSYALVPPTTTENAFTNVSQHTNIHVPAGTVKAYQKAIGWSKFLHFFEISELPEGSPTDQVGVTVTENYATFTWPVNPTASSYTLTITKDGEVFCTLTFNSLGQLVGMAFAPARDGANRAPAAEQTAYGFSFVVSGLETGNYNYTFISNDSENNVIETYEGSFTADVSTALDNATAPTDNLRKFMRDGQVLIQRGDMIYNLQGQVVD